ncbi:non-functional pseudokinase ZED1-like [Cornus florida]|uniref:non-functional pseudokinase ZED1-like n=1 Tax=Cornus florida TaxID=4283 RepID=UPI0028992DE9|nr:non-functional pseudokinase ZED1-like [Cornus florida]XP_059646411.1 non-functional pseudokinase ZED1-like [Cornus florida]
MGTIFSSSSRVSKKERYMLCNGGLLLEELLRSCDGKYNSFRIFSANELAQATNYYHEQFVDTDYCTMYNGFFNGRPIFVKCPRDYDKRNVLEKAINEVVFASQVNSHKNILMLLGCCLETEFPVLVYEYAENGTLSRLIGTEGSHNHRQLLPWNNRLKVAKEIADSLAYLHTGLSTPIIHRCIKSSNVLVDANYVAKLSEFSLSVSIPLGKEYLETSVVGTTGYAAPEYVATGKLTDKCDVYLFGALLIEILCGERYYDLLRRFWDLRDMNQNESNSVSSGACNWVNKVEGRDCDQVASNHRAIDLISTNNFQEVHGCDQEISNVLEVNDTHVNSTSDDDLGATNSTSTIEQGLFRDMDMEFLHQSILEGAEKYIGPENMLESHLKQSMACSQLAFECGKPSAQERPTMTEVAKELRRIISFQCISPTSP